MRNSAYKLICLMLSLLVVLALAACDGANDTDNGDDEKSKSHSSKVESNAPVASEDESNESAGASDTEASESGEASDAQNELSYSDKFVGTWYTVYDFSSIVKTSFETIGEYGSYFKFDDGMDLIFMFDFTDKGVMHFYADEDSFDAVMENCRRSVLDGFPLFIEAYAESFGYTVDDILNGQTVEEMAEGFWDEMNLYQIEAVMKVDADYYADETTLYLDDGDGTVEYKFEGTNLLFKSSDGYVPMSDDMPITLKKA